MIKVGGKFNGFGLNRQAFLDAVNEWATRLVKEAGNKWLDVTVRTKTHIPTWSGASRSAFKKLANAIGTTVPIGPILSEKDRTALGYSASTGRMFLEPGKMRWGWEWSTSLEYLIYNEANRATPGMPPQPWSDRVRYTPYNFMAKGEAALNAFQGKMSKMPSVAKFIEKVPL